MFDSCSRPSCHSSITWSFTEWHSMCWSIISPFNVTSQSCRANFYRAIEGQRCLGWRTSWRRKWGYKFPMQTSPAANPQNRSVSRSLSGEFFHVLGENSLIRLVIIAINIEQVDKMFTCPKEGNFYEVLSQVLVMGNLSALFFGQCFRMFNFYNLVVKVKIKIKCPSLVWWL